MRYGDPLYIPNTEETRKKQSEAKKGIIPWNKGKTEVYSEESLKKMSLSQKQNTSSHFRKGIENPMFGKTGKKNPMFGKTLSKEARQKISLANTGRKFSEESRKKMSLSQKGKKLSDTAKKNISEAKKGKKNPMYGKKGKDNPFFGRHHTEEVRKQKSIQSKEFANRPEVKEAQREVLRKSRHNQVKPNKQELKIKKILTESKIEFSMFVNVKYSHLQHEADFLIKPNKIIEFNGTYSHADPRKYKPGDKIWSKVAKDIWKKEKIMLDKLKKQDYKTLVIWEMDLEKDTENIVKKILKFAKS